jgi:DmsE family decaheme c-type cytochrome
MKRFLLCMALIALLPGFTSQGYAASGNKKAAVVTKAPAQNPADFVGSDVCATCHAEVAKKFSDNPHSKLALLHNGTGATCESCHGGGKAHVESGGDVTKIKQISKLTPTQVDETCLGCHAGAHPNFDRSPHGKAGVSCTSCHSVHSGDTDAKLLKASQPKLCYQCHTDVKPSFDMPFHHKVNEGLVKCSDCHDAHGTFTANNVRSTSDMNLVCTKCHAETRGPWVFEHAVIKGEGCMGCHTPHGSQNPRLLNVANINQLCNQCHSPVAASTVHGMNAGSADRPPCISCHTMIHGSNVNQAFIR